MPAPVKMCRNVESVSELSVRRQLVFVVKYKTFCTKLLALDVVIYLITRGKFRYRGDINTCVLQIVHPNCQV